MIENIHFLCSHSLFNSRQQKLFGVFKSLHNVGLQPIYNGLGGFPIIKLSIKLFFFLKFYQR